MNASLSRFRASAWLTLVFGCLSAVATPSIAAPKQTKLIAGPGKRSLTATTIAKAEALRTSTSKAIDTKRAGDLGRRVGAHAKPRLPSDLREELTELPLLERLGTLKAAAEARGQTVPMFKRTLRGMTTVGGQPRELSVTKTFFAIEAATFDLLPQVMGKNVVWFAANSSPGHLHTLLADQDGSGRFTHNTYGKVLDLAAFNTGYTQYAAPVQLTDSEMERFVRYLNSGITEHRRISSLPYNEQAAQLKRTYGFKTSKGELICDTTCTNWATSAPIGELEPWAAALDRDVIAAAQQGALPKEYAQGLHAAMAAQPTPRARTLLVSKFKKLPGVTADQQAAADRLNGEFKLVAKNFPNRPLDLVARQSLASVTGASRAQDPAKFMYDLFMSDRVPAIAVINPQTTAFKKMTFDLEMMGTIGTDGVVTNGEGAPPAPVAAATPTDAAAASGESGAAQ